MSGSWGKVSFDRRVTAIGVLLFVFVVTSVPVLAQTETTPGITGADSKVVRTYTRTYTSVNGQVITDTGSGPLTPTPTPTPASTTTTSTVTTRTIVRRILPDGSVQVISEPGSEVKPPPSVPTTYSTNAVTRRYRVMPDGTRVEITDDAALTTPVKSLPAITETKTVVSPPSVQTPVTTVRSSKSVETKLPPKPEEKTTSPVTPAGVVPDLETLYLILWSTLANIESARTGQDYQMLWRTISPRLQSELDPTTLQISFASLNDSQMKLGDAVGKTPVFEIAPHIVADGRLRLRGKIPSSPKMVRFDLLYVHVNGLWRLDAIAFAEG